MEKVRKVLFVIHGFTIGGTTSSLEALLSLLDKEKVCFDVLALDQSGPRIDSFKKYHLVPENIWLSTKIVNGGYGLKILHRLIVLTKSIFRRFGIDLTKIYSRIGGKQLNFNKYDVVIAFVESLARYVAYYPIDKKVIYIRAELERHLQLCDRKVERKALNQFDLIIGVSKFAQNSIIKVFPELKSKTISIPNVINADSILKKADEQIDDPSYLNDKFTIVSIGRMDPVKQFELIPDIAHSMVKKSGSVFRWYIIGGGFVDNVNFIKEKIRQLNLEEVVVLLGEKKNVYPYLKHADLLVHTSKSETFSRVVNDAKILGLPVVVNNYECASEFLIDGKEGIITPISEMDHVICKMISDKEYLMNFKSVLKDYRYNNEDILNDFYSICEV